MEIYFFLVVVNHSSSNNSCSSRCSTSNSDDSSCRWCSSSNDTRIFPCGAGEPRYSSKHRTVVTTVTTVTTVTVVTVAAWIWTFEVVKVKPTRQWTKRREPLANFFLGVKTVCLFACLLVCLFVYRMVIIMDYYGYWW